MPKYQVPALDKFAAVVDLLSQGEQLELTEIARRVKIPKASLYRLLAAMQAHGYVDYAEDSKKYGLGVGLLEVGTALLDHIPLRIQALPHLQKVTAETGLSSHLGLLAGPRVAFVATMQSPVATRIAARVGRSFPLYPSAPGVPILAHMQAAEVARRIREDKLIQPYTPNSLKGKQDLVALLKKVRDQGYYLDDEYFFQGIRCIGAPVFDAKGRVSAGICVSGTVDTVPDERMESVTEAVRECAKGISTACGHDHYFGSI